MRPFALTTEEKYATLICRLEEAFLALRQCICIMNIPPSGQRGRRANSAVRMANQGGIVNRKKKPPRGGRSKARKAFFRRGLKALSNLRESRGMTSGVWSDIIAAIGWDGPPDELKVQARQAGIIENGPGKTNIFTPAPVERHVEGVTEVNAAVATKKPEKKKRAYATRRMRTQNRAKYSGTCSWLE